VTQLVCPALNLKICFTTKFTEMIKMSKNFEVTKIATKATFVCRSTFEGVHTAAYKIHDGDILVSEFYYRLWA
jgi:hypothetical protein